MSSYSLSLQELSKLSDEALASVMGPDDDTAMRDLLEDKATLIAEIAQAAKGDDSLSDAELRLKLRQLQQALIGDKAIKLAAKLKQTHKKLAAIGGAKGTAANRIATAYQAYQDSIKFIQETVNRINRADNKINKLNRLLKLSTQATTKNQDSRPYSATKTPTSSRTTKRKRVIDNDRL